MRCVVVEMSTWLRGTQPSVPLGRTGTWTLTQSPRRSDTAIVNGWSSVYGPGLENSQPFSTA